MDTMLKIKIYSLFFLICSSSLFLSSCDETFTPKALIPFQFDHPFITQYKNLKPLFDSKGIKASLMVTPSEVGKSKFFMSWDQLTEMYNEGWEIGSHTVNHYDLRDVKISTIRHELSQSKAILEAHGFQNIKNFAYPHSYYDEKALSVMSEYYRSARTSVAQTGYFLNPKHINPYELSSYEGRFTTENVVDAYTYIDKAKKEGKWLIFTLHEVRDNESADDILEKNEISDIKALEILIDYIQARDIPIVTTEQALNDYIGFE